MNPAQGPGNPNPGGTSTPPTGPSDGSVVDMPEDGFGFSDDQPQLPPVQPILQQAVNDRRYTSPAVAAPIAPAPVAPVAPAPIAAPAPMPAPTPPPVQPAPQPVPPVVQPTPVAPPMPAAPVSAPFTPPLPTQMPQPAPQTTMDIMPPAAIPAVPTLAPQPVAAAQPPVATPTPPVPTTAAPVPMPAPAPGTPPLPPAAPIQPPVVTEPVDLNAPFDPAKVPVHASSTPENPITATFTPQNVTHIPQDVAQRIGEKPMQNSRDILRQIKHGLDGSRFKSILSFVAFTAAIFVAAFLINQFVFQSYYVEGTSMTPTLQNNDRLIISKVERTMANVQGKPYIPERGQIVVLDSSIVGLNGQHEQLIKRVIGLPGDQIHIEAGTVIVTNTQHPNGYDVTRDLGLTNLQATFVEAPVDVVVPQGSVYVMGDNREQGGSYDSRAFGAIEGDKIQGRLWGRILPIDHAKLF